MLHRCLREAIPVAVSPNACVPKVPAIEVELGDISHLRVVAEFVDFLGQDHASRQFQVDLAQLVRLGDIQSRFFHVLKKALVVVSHVDDRESFQLSHFDLKPVGKETIDF